ncbi:hypothetical protein GQ457_07G017180 [Hibiscus cannabinus]
MASQFCVYSSFRPHRRRWATRKWEEGLAAKKITQMPVHYPRYSKADYEKMEEWRIDMLLKEYGFSSNGGTVDEKRAFAMGAFLWPDQL